MCLLLIAIDFVADVPLLLLGNRDEFHGRASAAAQSWTQDARVVGGRDLVAGGSWLALRADGRFAAVTNLRSGIPATAPRSRGWLVRDFVAGDAPARSFLDRIRTEASDYGPFNLVVGDRDGAVALGSGDLVAERLDPGIHVISNGAIGAHWPKTERLRRHFIEAIESSGAVLDEKHMLDLLMDEQQPIDSSLPDTWVGLELERRLAPIFIRGDHYGTRAGTLVTRRANGSVILRERRFGPNAREEGEIRWVARTTRGFSQGALA